MFPICLCGLNTLEPHRNIEHIEINYRSDGLPAFGDNIQFSQKLSSPMFLCFYVVQNSAAADEVDDLDLIGFGDGGFGPIFAADDAVVDLDRDTAAGKLEMFEKLFYIDVFGNRSLFAVHNDLHRYIIYARRF